MKLSRPINALLGIMFMVCAAFTAKANDTWTGIVQELKGGVNVAELKQLLNEVNNNLSDYRNIEVSPTLKLESLQKRGDTYRFTLISEKRFKDYIDPSMEMYTPMDLLAPVIAELEKNETFYPSAMVTAMVNAGHPVELSIQMARQKDPYILLLFPDGSLDLTSDFFTEVESVTETVVETTVATTNYTREGKKTVVETTTETTVETTKNNETVTEKKTEKQIQEGDATEKISVNSDNEVKVSKTSSPSKSSFKNIIVQAPETIDNIVNDPESALQETARVSKIVSDEMIYTAVEQPAEFPGGLSALTKWFGENLNYPEDARKNNISGKVVVEFVVNSDGSVSRPEIVKGVHPSLDREAMRIVSIMPDWIPARNNGERVATYYILPVMFNVQNAQ